MADRGTSIRIVDPIITNVVQGYVNAGVIYPKLFPEVQVGTEAFKVKVFGPEAFRLLMATRAMRARRKRVEFPIETTTSVVLDEKSLEEAYDDREIEEAERAEAGALYIKSRERRAQRLKGQIDLNVEYEAAQLLQTSGNYADGLTGTPKTLWDADGSDPISDIENAKELVRSKIGIKPNKLWMGPKVFKALKNHAKIVERIKYSQRGIVTEEILSAVLGIEVVVVGEMVYSADGSTLSDIWGNYAGLIWTPPGAEADREVPSFGYLFRKSGYPKVWTYADPSANASEVLVVEDIVGVKQLSSYAGYLFVNPVSG